MYLRQGWRLVSGLAGASRNARRGMTPFHPVTLWIDGRYPNDHRARWRFYIPVGAGQSQGSGRLASSEIAGELPRRTLPARP